MLQRRCIHDAFGNEDPVKVRETAIPRPHARKSNLQGKDIYTKKPVLSKQRVLQHDLASTSSAVSDSNIWQDGAQRRAPVANMVAQSQGSDSSLKTETLPFDGTMQRKIAECAGLLLDPVLFSGNADFPPSTAQSTCPNAGTRSASPAKIGHPTITGKVPMPSQTPHPMDNFYNISKHGAGPLEPKADLEQPASSLVSPPASSHDDLGNSPSLQWAPSSPLPEQPSPQLKQLQRYTPESGSLRRTSSSSAGEIPREQSASRGDIKPPSDPRPNGLQKSMYMTDEESLRLIKELQAQDLGLRKRGKP